MGEPAVVKSRVGWVPNMESRWPPILAYVFVFAIVQLLPSRYEVFGAWFPWVLFAFGLASMLAVGLAPTRLLWHRIERPIIITIFLIVAIMLILTIVRLIADILSPKQSYGSIVLLQTAVQVWFLNIGIFALLYWQLDRPGPEARATDFHFADSDVEGQGPWKPRFMDYLFLGFATSTSFTPPEYSRPTSHRAKLLLMLQALIALTTLFLIGARAISTLA
jgi:hypothetical protein